MTEVRIYRDNKNNVVKYIVSGHARYGKLPGFIEYIMRLFLIRGHAGYPEAGKDVVCAAVSSIAQSAVIGLKQVLGLQLGIEIGDGYLECVLPENISDAEREKAGIILETMVFSMKDLENQYGKLIRVIETEV